MRTAGAHSRPERPGRTGAGGEQAEIQTESGQHQALDALHFGGAHFRASCSIFGGVDGVHDAFLLWCGATPHDCNVITLTENNNKDVRNNIDENYSIISPWIALLR
jgi:hypothetical protein